MGVLCLAIQIWVGSIHAFYCVNYADASHITMVVSGWGLILTEGGGLVYTSLVWSALNRYLPTSKEASSRLGA
jgi:hypothetical protein